MAEKLKVDYRMIESLIKEMSSQQSSVETIYSEMTTTVESLVSNEYMEAESANAYIEEFKAILAPEMEALSQLISDYYSQLKQICEIFADADSKVANMLFSGNSGK